MKHRKEDDPSSSEFNHQSYRRGCKEYDAGDFIEALKSFKEALDYWPDDFQTWMALGNSYSALKRHKKAEVSFRRALELSDEDSKENILYNLGNSLFDQDRFGEAAEIYRAIKPGSKVWKMAQSNLRLAIAK